MTQSKKLRKIIKYKTFNRRLSAIIKAKESVGSEYFCAAKGLNTGVKKYGRMEFVSLSDLRVDMAVNGSRILSLRDQMGVTCL